MRISGRADGGIATGSIDAEHALAGENKAGTAEADETRRARKSPGATSR